MHGRANICPYTHEYLENTIASMHAAFDMGANVVEFDVHPTTDSNFAIFHDWTIDCRTNGAGETRSHNMEYLKTLDIGYYYTADGGKSFPFRNKAIGQMPSIDEMMNSFPNKKFLLNFKSNDASEGELLAKMLEENPNWRDNIWAVYGGIAPTQRALDLIEGLKGYSNTSTKDCLIKYLALGWSGYMPKSCKNTIVSIPINMTNLVWGWPNRFQQRIKNVESKIVLMGEYKKGTTSSTGIDELEQLNQIPSSFDGYIWTNKIEIIASSEK
jgi:glycerophosphoryl diester phosphodiesterase